jgi:type IV secretory pathway TrbD component
MDERLSPVYTVLHEPMMLMGVERVLAIFNATMTLALVVGMHLLFMVPIGLVVHLLLRYMNKRDPQASAVYQRYYKQVDHYDPWARPGEYRFEQARRPKGFGRAMAC